MAEFALEVVQMRKHLYRDSYRRVVVVLFINGIS